MYFISSTGDDKKDFKTPKRVNPIVYLLITNNLATLQELKYVYSIDEVLDLYEICLATVYNKHIALEN